MYGPITNVWSLQNPTDTGEWKLGQVEVHSDGDNMYQASNFYDTSLFIRTKYVLFLFYYKLHYTIYFKLPKSPQKEIHGITNVCV